MTEEEGGREGGGVRVHGRRQRRQRANTTENKEHVFWFRKRWKRHLRSTFGITVLEK